MRDAGGGRAHRSEIGERPSAQREAVYGGARRSEVERRQLPNLFLSRHLSECPTARHNCAAPNNAVGALPPIRVNSPLSRNRRHLLGPF